MATVKLPITTDENNNFIFLESTNAVVKQKLKNILLTSPGELLMNPVFGVGIRRYLFEFEKILTFSDNEELVVDEEESLENKVKDILIEQCKNYLQEINILNISIKLQENILFVQINYKIFDSFPDQLEMQIGF